MTELYEIMEPLVVPETAIATVLDWIKAEQVRVIQKDRTLGINKIRTVDWLTETADNLKVLQERATADRNKVEGENARRTRINARREAESAQTRCLCDTCCSCQKKEL